MTGAVCSESSSVSCSRPPSIPTEDSSPSPGTRCCILGITLNPTWTQLGQLQKCILFLGRMDPLPLLVDMSTHLFFFSPSAAHIHHDAAAHYYFIGRMLGKVVIFPSNKTMFHDMSDLNPAQAMYENLLVELPLAPFFLSKLLGQKHFVKA